MSALLPSSRPTPVARRTSSWSCTSPWSRTSPWKRWAATTLAAAALAGCESTGLSPREGVAGGTGSQPNYANYVYSLYSASDLDAAHAARPTLTRPARIAVAQIGEVAPPQGMLDQLRNEPAFVAAAAPIPGSFEPSAAAAATPAPPAYGTLAYATDRYETRDVENLSANDRQARAHVARMRRYARDMGMDYLFLFGGTIDHGSTSTGLSVLDLTVVGAFVVPSQQVGGTGRAAGTLIEVDSGRVILAVTAEAKQEGLSASVGLEGRQARMLQTLRETLVNKLTAQLLTRLKNP